VELPEKDSQNITKAINILRPECMTIYLMSMTSQESQK
jgi:hypothetical protein